MAQLNIKNKETCRLAKELSRLTGEKVTQAVTQAIRERLDKLNMSKQKSRQHRLKEILSIADKCAALPEIDPRRPDEILYDEHGLPKDSIR